MGWRPTPTLARGPKRRAMSATPFTRPTERRARTGRFTTARKVPSPNCSRGTGTVAATILGPVRTIGETLGSSRPLPRDRRAGHRNPNASAKLTNVCSRGAFPQEAPNPGGCAIGSSPRRGSACGPSRLDLKHSSCGGRGVSPGAKAGEAVRRGEIRLRSRARGTAGSSRKSRSAFKNATGCSWCG